MNNSIGNPLNEKDRINELILNIEKKFNTHKILEIKSKFKDKKQEKLFFNVINSYWSIGIKNLSLEANIIYRENLDPKYYPNISSLLKDAYSISYNREYFNLVYNLFSSGININNRFEIYKEILKKYSFEENGINDFINYLKIKHDGIKKNKKMPPYNRVKSDLSYEIEELELKKDYEFNISKLKQDGVIFLELFMKHGLNSISSNNPVFLDLIKNNDVAFYGISPSFFQIKFEKNVSLEKQEKIKNILFNLINEDASFFQLLINTWKDSVYYNLKNEISPKKMKITKNLLNIYINKNDQLYLNLTLMRLSKFSNVMEEYKKILKDISIRFKDYNWLQEEIETNPNRGTEDLSLNVKKRRM